MDKKKYQREWIAKRRFEFFKDKVCVDCGEKENLELDHIDPKQKLSHNIWSWSKDRRDKEIKKCQVLCNPCHKKKSKKEQFSKRKHGRTWYAYGCRCDICKEAQRKHNAQRKLY